MTKHSIPSTDDAWDDRQLGAEEEFVEVASPELANSIDEAAGTQLISIRMQKTMIDDFKAIAARNKGIGYQTLMKQILQRFIDGERRLMWNEFVSKKLKEETAAATEEGAAQKPKARKSA